MFNKYYADELSFMREMGREFSESHPEAAHFLAETGSDPDVERLLEGFAFLTGRLRQKLDDELPEVTQSLMSLLWPHYLRPIPSMTILRFECKTRRVTGPQKIPAGTEVDSAPVEGVPCRFRTCYPAELYPVDLQRVDYQLTSAPPSLVFDFRVWEGVPAASLGLERLRFHLHGEPASTQLLYLWLCRYLKGIEISVQDEGRHEKTFSLPADALKPVGFGEEESLLPFPTQSFPGFRLLQEYFSLPAKYMFFDLSGLDRLHSMEGTVRFQVRFLFSRGMQAPMDLGEEGILLHCTPAINLFSHEADPIRIDHRKVEYRVRPSGANPLFYEIYSVDSVFGMEKGVAGAREYFPFYSFHHRMGGGGKEEMYYHTRQEPSVVGYGTDTYVGFVYDNMENVSPEAETVSIELTCTNRWLPTQLRPGDIQVPTSSTPEYTRFTNLIRATTPVMPPLGGGLHWRLISHMALNYLSLTHVEVLRNMLNLYNFQGLYDRQAARTNEMRMAAIRKVRTEPTDHILSGVPVRGAAIELELQEDQFPGEGDMFLFANVLNHVFSLYATINSFTRLTVKGAQHGEIYQWPPQFGMQTLL